MAMRDGVDAIVEQWAQARPELDTTAMAIFGRVFRLARLGGDEMEQVYARYGIGRPEFDVLATLRRAPAPHRLTPGALATSMMISTAGTTARLDRLERTVLIRRTPAPDDRRSIFVELTQKGTALIDEAVVAGLTRQQELLGHLSPEHQQRLGELLREALAPLER